MKRRTHRRPPLSRQPACCGTRPRPATVSEARVPSSQHPLLRFGRLATAAPATVPGICAWAVTVAPVVWSGRDVPWPAEAGAIVGLLSLGVGTALERPYGARIRSWYLWLFTSACGVAWLTGAAHGEALLDDLH